jgi:predicted dehydrogenase
MSEKKLRWGILGTAEIARKNWKAIRNSGNSTVAGVASRDLGRARQFITECQSNAPMEPLPVAFGSYEELIGADNIKAVYIPLPTSIRKEWVIRAAEAGKHVLCEKPCATSVADLAEMLDACRKQNVQFMDGVMFMHSLRLASIREILNDQTTIGKIRRITSAFSFCAPDEFFTTNIRAKSDLEPHGCLGDLGWYCIRIALCATNGQLPRSVTGRILNRGAGPNDVPTEFLGELFFDNDVSAGFYCSFITAIEQWVQVAGIRGLLRVPDFVLPFFGNESAFEVTNSEFNISGCDFNMEAHQRRSLIPEYSNSHSNAQETNLFRNFADQVLSGRRDNAWPEVAFKTQQVMNACFDSALANSTEVKISG